ncbi:MAG TPA: glycine rich domain-containing protein [Bacilli bacterium]|nr:glycine rich domain-containing protein [Bacilli bacterium]
MKINIKHDLIVFSLGLLVASVICVSAASIISSKNITYTNSKTNVTNVGDALDELYGKSSCSYYLNQTFDFQYDGYEQFLVTGCKGYYKLETWGAQGGSAFTTYYGGYGAYAVGNVFLEKATKVYIYVGGQGLSCSSQGSSCAGGYNGGGSGYASESPAPSYTGGGGATHIALVGGLLSTLSSNVSDVLIISGGGGGGNAHNNDNHGIGGNGGGYVGMQETSYTGAATGYSNRLSFPGTSSKAGCNNGSNGCGGFGYGGSSTYYGSGGGAGYYGGSSADYSGGSGGSGFIANSLLVSSSQLNKHMTCYNCTTSSGAATMTNTTTNVSSTATADYAKSGNGYARITYLGMTLN